MIQVKVPLIQVIQKPDFINLNIMLIFVPEAA